MRVIVFFITASLMACDASLSEKERQTLKKEMEQREVKKVSEDDIIAETFEQGKKLVREYESDSSDSLLTKMNASIIQLGKNDSTDNETYWKLIEAYKYNLTQGGQLSDNVQRDGDYLIYTAPYIENDEFAGIYLVRIPKKEIVLSM